MGSNQSSCRAPVREGAAQESEWGESMLAPISSDPPPFPAMEHPVKPLHVSSDLSGTPVPTNKFMGNLLVGSTNQPTFTQPYVLRPKTSAPYGLSMCCPSEPVFGPSIGSGRVKSYHNVVTEDLGVGAVEFSAEPTREIVQFDDLGTGAKVTFQGVKGSKLSRISSPIVRGMVYGTFECEQTCPIIFTQHTFQAINGQPLVAGPDLVTLPAGERFDLKLSNGQCWLLYSLSGDIQFSVSRRRHQLRAAEKFTGTLRCTLLPSPSDADILDKHREVIPVGCRLTAENNSYTLNWETEGGDACDLLHFTMLHQRAAMMSGQPTELTLRSTAKGPMIAYIGCSWRMEEELPSISWLPPKAPDENKVEAIRTALIHDIDVTFPDHEGLTKKFMEQKGFFNFAAGNYFAGKELYKYALLALVADALDEVNARDYCIAKLKVAMMPFITNAQTNSLRYDVTWGGLIPIRGLRGGKTGVLKDFGATYYNDHHYHWGYFIQTAAIIGHFDKAWALEHREWVEALIRDVSNPSPRDPYFTTWRNFDWFSGHCWSQGILESEHGKDQESTSEEINYHYGVMLWGIAVGSPQLEQLGRLMTAVATRSIQTYFLIDSANEAHPPSFIGNKVTGIFQENKVDYTTWFGSNPEYIHGIQMLPMNPIMETVRYERFVAEEWPLLEQVAHKLTSGWKSILWMNYAIVDAEAAYQQLQEAPLDDGVTRTWALFWAATRPNAAFHTKVALE